MAKTTTAARTAVRASSTNSGSTPHPGVAPDAAPVAPSPADPPAVKAQSTSPRARKAAAEKPEAVKKPAATKAAAGKATAKSAGTRAKTEKGAKEKFVHTPKGPDLREDLRSFVQAQPGGWGHHDWITFLDHLKERGHDTSNPEAIGLLLERERLAAILEGVQGMGPRRIQAVVERYDTAWSAHAASVDELSTLAGMNRALAEKVRQALHA